jgi:hypothetical protein
MDRTVIMVISDSKNFPEIIHITIFTDMVTWHHRKIKKYDLVHISKYVVVETACCFRESYVQLA